MNARRGGSDGGRGGAGSSGTVAADPRLELTPSPHLKAPDSTPRIMWTVVATLVPVVAASAWFFGPSALLVLAAATAGAVGTERVLGREGSLADGSAAITGILLGLTLPASIPLWMAFLGGVVGISVGKTIFGGLGQNIFNPALLGRAFLQAAFPEALTTWSATGLPWTALRGDNFAAPFTAPEVVDGITGPTPLGLMKFEGEATPLTDLLIGSTAGSLGETSALLILLGGGWLAWKRYLNWRIPVGVFVSVAALSSLLHAVDPGRLPGAPFMLLSGGLVLGAVYMATDMVTAPVTNLGAWIFAAGIGVITVLIRYWGGLPEGIMYAILFMNALVPLIDRLTQPKVFGARPVPEGAA